jgi:hypothetical protein
LQLTEDGKLEMTKVPLRLAKDRIRTGLLAHFRKTRGRGHRPSTSTVSLTTSARS